MFGFDIGFLLVSGFGFFFPFPLVVSLNQDKYLDINSRKKKPYRNPPSHSHTHINPPSQMMLSEERNPISKHILLSFLMTLEIITCRRYLSLQLFSYDCFTASNTFTCMSATEKVTENGSCWESMSPCLEWHALSGQQELLALQPISTWPAEWLAA